MRIILIAVGCLVVGALGALGYSHYLGEGKQLADLQDQLAQANASLAKASTDVKQAKSESDALSSQVQQLTASNDSLKKQVAQALAPPPAPPAPTGFAAIFSNMSGKVKDITAQRSAAKLAALKQRLHLTPDQEAKLKEAMEEEDKRTGEMAEKMMSGKFNPMDAAAEVKKDMANGQPSQTSEQVLQEMLTPEQKTEYQQMQKEEKDSAMETHLTMETNEMAPALGLNDAQKDQVYSALGSVEAQTQDPKWIQANVDVKNPIALMDAEQKAKEDALSKVLTPDQLAQWKQQQAGQLQLQREITSQFMSVNKSLNPSAGNPAPAPTTPAAPANP